MRVWMVGLALAGLGLGTATSADAQRRSHPPGLQEVSPHRGFWLGFGFGGGWERFDFDLGNRGRGGAAYLRMGGTVNPHVLFGGEALAWFRADRFGEDIERVNVTASALLYPGSRGGWFLKAGGGVATSNRFGAEQTGIGTTFGTGYDLRLGGNFFVTPNVDLMVQFFDEATTASLLFTLGVIWH